jgi:hypothetical protein
MKITKIDTDIDFIGGEGVLTALEEKALHDYFKQQKLVKTLDSQSLKSLTDKKRSNKKERLLSKST